MMVQQQQQRPACVITIVETAPPLFVETTQAEFRAVVQRLTGSNNDSKLNNKNNHNNCNSLLKSQHDDHFAATYKNLPSSQSELVSSSESPITAPLPSRRSSPAPARACAGVPNSIATAESSESLCDTSDDAAARRVTINADHNYNTMITSCNIRALASCSKKVKAGMCCSHHEVDDINMAEQQQQQLDIDCNSIESVVQESITASLLDNMIPGASSFTCAPSIAAATSFNASFLHGEPPPSLAARSAADPPCAAIHSCTGKLITAVSHNDDEGDGDDDDFPGQFHCNPASLPPLVEFMIADGQQQLELLIPNCLYSSSNSPARPAVATTPLPPSHPINMAAQWEIMNSSFTWKEDDFLCVSEHAKYHTYV